MEIPKASNSLAFTLSIIFVLGTIIIFFNVQTANAAGEKEQIIINPNNIKNLTAYGETLRTEYPENYPPSYLFDGLVNSYSFWTQQGKSGFDLILNQKIEKPVCSMEIVVNQPQNQPFKVFVNDKNVYSGTLNSPNVQINSQQPPQDCLANVTSISMDFTPADSITWTTIAEVKLFSTNISPPPPTNPPGGGNATHIIIANSTVQIDLTDSQVSLNGLKIGAFADDGEIGQPQPQTPPQPQPQPQEPVVPPVQQDSDDDDDDKEEDEDEDGDDDKDEEDEDKDEDDKK